MPCPLGAWAGSQGSLKRLSESLAATPRVRDKVGFVSCQALCHNTAPVVKTPSELLPTFSPVCHLLSPSVTVTAHVRRQLSPRAIPLWVLAASPLSWMTSREKKIAGEINFPL